MRRIKVDLPLNGAYDGVEFSAAPRNTYDPNTSAEGIAQFLDELYNQMPHSTAKVLLRDPRAHKFREFLEGKVNGKMVS